MAKLSGRLVLAGDIGGTKTNMGLFSLGEGRPQLEAAETYPSTDAGSFQDLVARFVSEHPAQVSRGCFGIAGPVRNGVSTTTNLPWTVSEQELMSRFGWERARLVNDLAATAMSIPVLEESELHVLNPGQPDPDGPIGVVAPGTGLGIGMAFIHGGHLVPIASEGGHVDFAPTNELQAELLKHMWKDLSHVSLERLGSGPGLYTIYRWLREYRNVPEPERLTKLIAESDPSQVVSESGLNGDDPVCAEALDMFVSIIGSAAGNLALTAVTSGGLFLAGGVSPKILPKLASARFMESFTGKGRFKGLLEDIPVRVITNEQAALLGAACCAFETIA